MRKPGTVERGVLFGHDEVLFLADGGHHVLDFMLGLRQVPNESFVHFEANIRARLAATGRDGVKFLHVIFPDKQAVAEECPVRDPVVLGDQYLHRLPDLAEHVFYPRQFLKAAGPGIYMKTDTHVSDLGNVLSTAAIVERLTGEPQDANIARLMALEWVETQGAGDLGSRFEPPLGETKRRIHRSWIKKWLHNDLHGGNNGIVDIIFNKDAVYDKRLLVYGDSFARDFSGILGFFFKEVLFLRTPYFHPDIYDQVKPDYLITENVERYMNYCLPDSGRPSFFTFPYLENNGYAPGKEFAAAFSALLCYGRPPYYDYIAKNDLGT